MQSKRICQPPDWWDLFQSEADAAGVSLSALMGTAGIYYIANQGRNGKAKVAKLSQRPLASRPPKTKVEHVTYLPSQKKNGGAK
tara:strand:+ start:472 stop:723 length:252 start_codon:yes stop_codon:yes gene_type:complete